MVRTARILQGGDGMSILEVLALIGWGLAILLFVIWRDTEHYYRAREEELVKRWGAEIKKHREVTE